MSLSCFKAKEIVINLGFEDSSINAADEVMVVNETADNANTIPPAVSASRTSVNPKLPHQKSNVSSKSSVNRAETMQLVESSESLDLKQYKDFSFR